MADPAGREATACDHHKDMLCVSCAPSITLPWTVREYDRRRGLPDERRAPMTRRLILMALLNVALVALFAWLVFRG